MVRDLAPAAAPWAHYAKDGRAHLLIDHLQGVAELASGFGAKFGSAESARLAGLWHDLGKYSGDFQSMIRRENGVEAHIEVEGGPRDHSTAGALFAMERLGPVGAALAFVIAGHHAGLADRQALALRLETKASLLPAVRARSPHSEVMCASTDAWRPTLFQGQPDPLDLELWVRLLFSALCDADFLDTESFYRPDAPALRSRPRDLRVLRDQLSAHLDQKSRDDTEVNRARACVRTASVAAAQQASGVLASPCPPGVARRWPR